MNRREFITLLGGAAAWPLAARAQQRDRVRHIGVLMGGDENDPAAKLVSAFTQALADLGWTDGRADEMDPEDSCLWIHGTEDQQTIAFTPAGMEYLRELLAEHKRNRFSPRP